MWKLIFDYGFIALFGSARMLIRENAELKAELAELRSNKYLEEYEDDSDKIVLTAFEQELAESLPNDPVYGARAPRFNHQRNTTDLVNEARKKYEASLREAAEQEREVNEMIASIPEDTTDPEVRVSEAKAEYYVTKAKAILRQ